MLLYIITLDFVVIIHFTSSQKDVLELRQRREDPTYRTFLLQGK